MTTALEHLSRTCRTKVSIGNIQGFKKTSYIIGPVIQHDEMFISVSFHIRGNLSKLAVQFHNMLKKHNYNDNVTMGSNLIKKILFE